MCRKDGQSQVLLDAEDTAWLEEFCKATGGFKKGVVKRALAMYRESVRGMVPPIGHPTLPGIPAHGHVAQAGVPVHQEVYQYSSRCTGTPKSVPVQLDGTPCNSRDLEERSGDPEEREIDLSLSIPAVETTARAPVPTVGPGIPSDWDEAGKPVHAEAIGHDELTQLASQTLTGLLLPGAYREAMRRYPADVVRAAAAETQQHGRKPAGYWLKACRTVAAKPRLRAVPTPAQPDPGRCGGCAGKGKVWLRADQWLTCGKCNGTGRKRGVA